MADLTAGDMAPDFTLPRDGGGSVSLSEMRGSPVVLYFYPKDDTSGCTTEALDFTALADAFGEIGARVVGISPDPVKSHDKFIAKHKLSVILASDEAQATLSDSGVWKEKSMYGRTYMGVERSTFLIDRDGRIAAVWRKVKVAGHAEAVLQAAKAL